MMYTPLFHTIVERVLNSKTYTIAFIGDSITSCEWIHPNWRDIVRYVLESEIDEYLSAKAASGELQIKDSDIRIYVQPGDDPVEYLWSLPSWNITALNLAKNGSSSSEWMENKDQWFAPYTRSIDLAIVMGTCNDMDNHMPVHESVQSISAFLQYLKDAGV